jgi:hypothetical protein
LGAKLINKKEKGIAKSEKFAIICSKIAGAPPSVHPDMMFP